MLSWSVSAYESPFRRQSDLHHQNVAIFICGEGLSTQQHSSKSKLKQRTRVFPVFFFFCIGLSINNSKELILRSCNHAFDLRNIKYFVFFGDARRGDYILWKENRFYKILLKIIKLWGSRSNAFIANYYLLNY